jgi:hypothetical protein
VLINDHPKLHEIIGATWGPETATTFTVPDLRGRALYGAGTNVPLAATDPQVENQRGAKHRHTVAMVAASVGAYLLRDVGTNAGAGGGGGDGVAIPATDITVGPASTPLDGPAYAGILYVITTG